MGNSHELYLFCDLILLTNGLPQSFFLGGFFYTHQASSAFKLDSCNHTYVENIYRLDGSSPQTSRMQFCNVSGSSTENVSLDSE